MKNLKRGQKVTLDVLGRLAYYYDYNEERGSINEIIALEEEAFEIMKPSL